MFSEAASGIINYDRDASYKKTVDIKVLASENEEPVTSGYNVLFQDLPTTGDNNCNFFHNTSF